MPPRRIFEELRRAEQNDRQFERGKRHEASSTSPERCVAGGISPFYAATREW
jgi:hypothetical protein